MLGAVGVSVTATAKGRLAPPVPGNYVFKDINQNGVFDGPDVGISNVNVYLFQANGVLVETATTTSTGQFSFTSTLQASASYNVRIRPADAPAGLKLTPADQGSDDGIDSDASMVGSTAVITASTNASGLFPNYLGFGYQAGDPDLTLTKTTDSYSVTRGSTASFTLVVTNTGASVASGVVVKDTLDAGMGYVSSSPAATTTALSNGQVELTWGGGSTSLAAGGSATYTVTVTANADGVLTNVAGVTATTPDATPRNNLARACITVPVKLCQGEAYVTSLSANLSNVEWFRNGSSVGTGTSLTITTSGTYSYTSLSTGTDCQTSSCCPLIIYDGSVNPPTLAASMSAICYGTTASLTATNCAGTLAWSTGAADNGKSTITVAPLVTTTYSVTCIPTAASACPASSTMAITVNPAVTATVAGATICDNTSTTLTANASGGSGFTYAWSPTGTISGSSSASAVVVSPRTTTVYSVTVTNSNGCSNTAVATVTVNPAVTAVIAISPSNTICYGTTVSLTASGGTVYRWSTGETGATISAQPTSTTVYSVTATSADQCVGVTSMTVTVNPAVTATVAGATICDNTSTTLTASVSGGSGFTYAWSPTATISGSSSASAVLVSPRMTTVYSITVTNSNGCSTTATATVTVNPAVTAVIAISPSNTICYGTTVSLTASGGTVYRWSTGETGTTISAQPTSTTVYSVTATSSDQCVGVTSTTVTVNPTPTLSINSVTTCADQDVTLSLTGCTGTATWSTGKTGNTLTISPLQTTTYSVTCVLATGCASSTTATVTVNEAPSVPQQNIVVTRSGCTGGTANNDASIALTGLQNTTRAAISTADGTTVANYDAATAVTGNAITFGNLPNPPQRVTYLVRLYSESGCYTEFRAALEPAQCVCPPAPKCIPVTIRKLR